MHTLLRYVDEKATRLPFARTIACYFHEGMLVINCLHRTNPPGGPRRPRRPHIHMQQLRQLALLDSPDGFRQGVTAFRNARNLAKKWRDELITMANEKAAKASFGSDQSRETDELSPNYEARKVKRVAQAPGQK